MAWLAARHAAWGPWVAVAAWTPLVAGCMAAGAGLTDDV
jgi:hypothetical protein